MVGLYFALIKQVFIHELLDTLGKHLSLKVSQGTFFMQFQGQNITCFGYCEV